MLLLINHASACHPISFSIQTTFELKREGELHRLPNRIHTASMRSHLQLLISAASNHIFQ
jgi:hypothetical protein